MNFGKTLELTSDQLKKLNLKYGKNEIRYEVFTMLQEIFKIFWDIDPWERNPERGTIIQRLFWKLNP